MHETVPVLVTFSINCSMSPISYAVLFDAAWIESTPASHCFGVTAVRDGDVVTEVDAGVEGDEPDDVSGVLDVLVRGRPESVGPALGSSLESPNTTRRLMASRATTTVSVPRKIRRRRQ